MIFQKITLWTNACSDEFSKSVKICLSTSIFYIKNDSNLSHFSSFSFKNIFSVFSPKWLNSLYRLSQRPCPFTDPKMFCASPNFFIFLSQPKFFEPAQKFIYILCQLQALCARQKDDLHSVKLVFVPTQKFLKRH